MKKLLIRALPFGFITTLIFLIIALNETPLKKALKIKIKQFFINPFISRTTEDRNVDDFKFDQSKIKSLENIKSNLSQYGLIHDLNLRKNLSDLKLKVILLILSS